MLKEVLTVAGGLIPPRPDDVAGQQRWQWFIFISILALASFFGLHLIWARNYFQTVTTGLDSIRLGQIEQLIRSEKTTSCMTSDKKFQADLNEKMAHLEDDYNSIRARQGEPQSGYRVPDCDEL
jgi:hypothetical protein